jgi:hypothetical protein
MSSFLSRPLTLLWSVVCGLTLTAIVPEFSQAQQLTVAQQLTKDRSVTAKEGDILWDISYQHTLDAWKWRQLNVWRMDHATKVWKRIERVDPRSLQIGDSIVIPAHLLKTLPVNAQRLNLPDLCDVKFPEEVDCIPHVRKIMGNPDDQTILGTVFVPFGYLARAEAIAATRAAAEVPRQRDDAARKEARLAEKTHQSLILTTILIGMIGLLMGGALGYDYAMSSCKFQEYSLSLEQKARLYWYFWLEGKPLPTPARIKKSCGVLVQGLSHTIRTELQPVSVDGEVPDVRVSEDGSKIVINCLDLEQSSRVRQVITHPSILLALGSAASMRIIDSPEISEDEVFSRSIRRMSASPAISSRRRFEVTLIPTDLSQISELAARKIDYVAERRLCEEIGEEVVRELKGSDPNVGYAFRHDKVVYAVDIAPGELGLKLRFTCSPDPEYQHPVFVDTLAHNAKQAAERVIREGGYGEMKCTRQVGRDQTVEIGMYWSSFPVSLTQSIN